MKEVTLHPSWRGYGTLKIALVAMGITLFACSSEQEPPQKISNPKEGSYQVLSQNWSPELSEKAHHTTFGSRLIPLSWFKNLRDADGTPLNSKANIEKWGFISAQKSKINPHALPVGFTLDTAKSGKKWLGLGCAACHTGMVEFNGTKILLDGGQGMVNFTLFESSIRKALENTYQNEAEIKRVALLIGETEEELKLSMASRIDYLKSRQQINATPVDYGYGRLDAFGQIFNTVGVELLGIPENRLVPDAPVSYPVLWNAPHLDLVQWNGSAPNAGPGPLFQNVTTAIAVYGQMEVKGSDESLGYKSTVDIPNLKQIEKWLYQLQSPQWPENILGKLDQSKVAAGEKIYSENCLRCHQLVDRNNLDSKLKATLVDVNEIGTDPKMVDNFINAKVKSGEWEGKKVLWLAGETIEKEDQSIKLVAHAAAGAALHHPLQTLDAIIEDYHSVYKAAINPSPNYYKARSLTGIWAAAPYLHNGSVLTLEELLSPVSERRKSFYVGDRNLDIERVGLISSEGENRSLFDTTLIGNSNSGHLYGTKLSKSEKHSLLEYLKSL